MSDHHTANRISQVSMLSGIDTMIDSRSAERAITLPVEGMSCASCVTKIEKGLSDVEGVTDAKVNLATERADTRSWTTLPQEVQLQRVLLPVGEHKMQIELVNAAGRIVDVIEETVIIKPKQPSFVIKHWNTPVPKKKAVAGIKQSRLQVDNAQTADAKQVK